MRLRLIASLAVAITFVAACSNANSSGGTASGRAGVDAHEIRVGGLAAVTGPLGDEYAPIFDGAQAYFDMVNEQGGVFGRKIKLVAKLDDQTDAARNVAQARALVEQHHVFAVIPVASPLFPGGKYLGAQGIPTFGWNVNPEWSSGPSLFGEKGSFLDFSGTFPYYGYWGKSVGAKKVAILAYNVSQARDCAAGAEKSYKKYGFDVVFNDASIPFGTPSLDADVQRMKEANVDAVSICMDITGGTLLSKTLRRAGLANVKQLWLNGYDSDSLAHFADLYEGVYFHTTFVPFESASLSPGLTQFLDEMRKHKPNTKISEVVLAGWINADLFVTGLKAAGKDLTRLKLIDAINVISNYTANQIVAPIDWRVQHTAPNPTDCDAFVQAQHGKFAPVLKQPFACYPHDSPTIPNV